MLPDDLLILLWLTVGALGLLCFLLGLSLVGVWLRVDRLHKQLEQFQQDVPRRYLPAQWVAARQDAPDLCERRPRS